MFIRKEKKKKRKQKWKRKSYNKLDSYVIHFVVGKMLKSWTEFCYRRPRMEEILQPVIFLDFMQHDGSIIYTQPVFLTFIFIKYVPCFLLSLFF